MWCRNCRQEVRGSAIEGARWGVACPRCRSPLSGPSTIEPPSDPARTPSPVVAQVEPNAASASSNPIQPPFDTRDFELEEELRSAERLLRSLGIQRVDGPHPGPSFAGSSLAADPTAYPQPNPTKRREADTRIEPEFETIRPSRESAGSLLAWFLVALAITCGAFGSVLLAWSWLANRPDLWTLGLPFAIGGQAMLLVGLFVQMDHLWQGQRSAKKTIAHLDSEIQELRHTAELMHVSQGAPSQAFYLHMAEGASPQMLLADLKGQLDMLATRLPNSR